MDELDLDQQRDAIIEEIKRVFPVDKPPKALVKDRNVYEGKGLLALFDGKTWIEVVNHPDLIYTMSEIEYLWAMKERTFIYYLPAFLVTTLNDQSWTMSSNPFSQIMEFAPEFGSDKLQAIISYCIYQEQYWRSQQFKGNYEAKLFESWALKLLFLLDEKKPKS